MTKEELQRKLDFYASQRVQYLAHVNACEGAIEALQSLIKEIEANEVPQLEVPVNE